MFFSPALEDYYQAWSINIEAWGGEFHKVVVQLYNCLARVYECYAEHAISSRDDMRDRRIARLAI
jgi:hypothetical protein